ncbi:hypothetical protein M422DRAFT_248522 [Sphaerobolus stellatus SS14]|uniref:Ubiquitin-like protease family profile domain-containing protein n=1 Tax=Sphaerobolus stellatus (strain SS14) TaxID=990650 RepID=A0A0C9W4R6_SPHS4|nr:hypothetical protein M422DRAFT_248522 [Sphaerobolus stellatus SS14]
MRHGDKETSKNPLSVFFIDSIVTQIIAACPAKDPFKPWNSIEEWECWVPETNIFEQDVIVLPWHIDNPEHWMCIGTHPKENSICLYNSLSSKLTREHKNILKWILRFLKWEHSERGLGPLSDVWNANLNADFELSEMNNPCQNNGSDCGIFTLIFAMELAHGRDPGHLGFTIAGEDVALMRQNIAICLGCYSLHFPLPPIPPTHVPPQKSISAIPPSIIGSEYMPLKPSEELSLPPPLFEVSLPPKSAPKSAHFNALPVPVLKPAQWSTNNATPSESDEDNAIFSSVGQLLSLARPSTAAQCVVDELPSLELPSSILLGLKDPMLAPSWYDPALFYTPTIRKWGLWKSDSLYYPVQIKSYDRERMMLFETGFSVSYTEIENPEFGSIPAYLIAPICWPWSLFTDNLPDDAQDPFNCFSLLIPPGFPDQKRKITLVENILFYNAPGFQHIFDDYQKIFDKQTLNSSVVTTKLKIMGIYGVVLGAVDLVMVSDWIPVVIIYHRRNFLVSELSLDVLYLEGILSEFVTGPGSGILACMATAYQLGIDAEVACRLLHDKPLVLQETDHEQAWACIDGHVSMPSPALYEDFEREHKICTVDFDIPLPVMLDGSDIKKINIKLETEVLTSISETKIKVTDRPKPRPRLLKKRSRDDKSDSEVGSLEGWKDGKWLRSGQRT